MTADMTRYQHATRCVCGAADLWSFDRCDGWPVAVRSGVLSVPAMLAAFGLTALAVRVYRRRVASP